MVDRSATPICPGADAFFAAPNGMEDPYTCPQRRVITTVPAIDIVMIGLSA